MPLHRLRKLGKHTMRIGNKNHSLHPNPLRIPNMP
jgi:hypothetical protein